MKSKSPRTGNGGQLFHLFATYKLSIFHFKTTANKKLSHCTITPKAL